MSMLYAAGLRPVEPTETPESTPKIRREKSTAELRGAVRRMLTAYVRRIERDGDVEAFAELDAMRGMLAEAIDTAAGNLLADPWSYSTADLAAELGTTKQNVHKRFGHHVTRRPGAQPANLR
jgi:hypothetical protein